MIKRGRFTHGLAKKLIFVTISLLLVCIIPLFISQVATANADDASIFLGPPPGETIILDGGDGMDIKRTTIAISELGVYSIEDRMRTPGVEVTQEDIEKNKIPENILRVMRGEEDLVDIFTLQAKDGKVILNRHGEVSVVLDLESREWIHDLSSDRKNVKMESRIVDEQEEFIRGEKRKIIYVEAHGKIDDGPVYRNYRVASGLGVIHMALTFCDLESVLYTLKDN